MGYYTIQSDAVRRFADKGHLCYRYKTRLHARNSAMRFMKVSQILRAPFYLQSYMRLSL